MKKSIITILLVTFTHLVQAEGRTSPLAETETRPYGTSRVRLQVHQPSVLPRMSWRIITKGHMSCYVSTRHCLMMRDLC